MAVAGALAVQIYRLIEQAIIDGAVVDSVKRVVDMGTDEQGNPKEPLIVTEKMAHPALQTGGQHLQDTGDQPARLPDDAKGAEGRRSTGERQHWHICRGSKCAVCCALWAAANHRR